LLALAEAAREEGAYDVELRYVQMALEAAPDDVQVNRQAGPALARHRRFGEALACWQRVLDQHPEDTAAAAELARATIERCRQRGGLESAAPPISISSKPKPTNHSGPPLSVATANVAPLAAEVAGGQGMKRSPLQQLEAAIREFPARVELYVQITPLYLEKDRDYDAERLLAKGLQATDNDPRVRQLWEDVTMIRLEKKLALARQAVAAEDNPNTRGELDKLVRERDKFETETFVSRAKREPDNAAVRVQLGQRLRRAGKVNEAAGHFQQALPDSGQRCFAALELGECSRELRDYPQALRYYRLAAASAMEADQLDCRKEALRQAARLAAKIKLFGVAQKYISELVRIDPTYTDAGNLLADIQKPAT
jgi:tetratricopeptide (TPR) repeat protein